MARLLFYSTGLCSHGSRILSIIEALISTDQVEVHQDIESLAERLRRPRNGVKIAVLFTADSEEFREVLALRDLFLDQRIILILPDRDSKTVAKGLTLRPRYFSFIDDDFRDTAAVLSKMLSAYDSY